MNLRLKILAIFLSVILLVAGVLLWAGYAERAGVEARYASSALHSRSLVWRGVVDDAIAGLDGTLTRMTRDRALKTALADADVAALREQINPLYSMLAAQGMVDRVGVFDANGRYLAMQGATPSAVATDAAVAQVMATGKVAMGVMLDENRVPMAVIATPLSSRGKAIGGGVLMRNLEWAVKQFTRRSEAEAGLFVDGRLLWHSDGFVTDLVEQPDQLDPFAFIDQGKNVYAVSRHEVEDLAGKAFATLVILQDHTQSVAAQRLQSRIALGVSVLVVGIALLLSYLLLTRMLRPLGRLSAALGQVSSGDLTLTIERQGSSEILSLQDSARQMVGHLRELLQQIHEVTDLVADRSMAMSGIAQGSLTNVGQQRGQMQQLLASVERMESTASTVEQRAVEASSRTGAIDGQVDASRRVVESSSATIHELANQISQSAEVVRKVREHSDRIRSFLVIIQEVAEQTNLLALNAAIESARAGEMGRGFAVVAEEVRNLSQRTTQNTREIQNVILDLHQIAEEACTSMDESVRIARESVGSSQQTNDSLAKIVGSVEEIRGMSGDIASMAGEQHQMAGDMSQYVMAVNGSTQQAEDQAHEVVASCERLVEVANSLRTLVGRFNL